MGKKKERDSNQSYASFFHFKNLSLIIAEKEREN